MKSCSKDLGKSFFKPRPHQEKVMILVRIISVIVSAIVLCSSLGCAHCVTTTTNADGSRTTTTETKWVSAPYVAYPYGYVASPYCWGWECGPRIYVNRPLVRPVYPVAEVVPPAVHVSIDYGPWEEPVLVKGVLTCKRHEARLSSGRCYYSKSHP